MITFDPDALSARLSELERELSAPGFWDDQQRAASVSAEHARMVMETYTAADLSAELNEPLDLPLSNRALATLADFKSGKLEKAG